MTSYKNVFRDWFDNEFIRTDFAKDMLNTVEASPFHREANVFVHTCMVVNEYINRSPEVWDSKDFLGALACAFHDVGKPMAEETNTRDDGSEYRSYKRHEVFSGALWLDHVLGMPSDHPIRSGLSGMDIYDVMVMIDHHLPYKYGSDKTKVLKTHMSRRGLVDVFIRVAQSDAYGRISDDQQGTHDRSDSWARTFLNTIPIMKAITDREIIILCGPSGSGKSTYLNTLDGDFECHSMDLVRLDSYGTDDYTEAFRMSQDDSEFSNKVTKDFVEKTKASSRVVVDNTSLTSKRRTRYVKDQSTKDSEIIGVVFLNRINTLKERCIERQKSDPTKVIPTSVIENQYFSFQPPMLGEVDTIEIINNGGDS